MFTGIVTAVGTVHRLKVHAEGMYLTIAAPGFLKGVHLGDSIAVEGCCLTVVQKEGDTFSVEIGLSTLLATHLGELTVGMTLNLEKALTLQQSMGGHWVTGHIDGVVEVVAIESEGFARRVTCRVPTDWMKWMMPKGSVTLNGVSLTIQTTEADRITMMLIPHTRSHTTLGRLQVGDRCNCEVDMMARYVEHLLSSKGLVSAQQKENIPS